MTPQLLFALDEAARDHLRDISLVVAAIVGAVAVLKLACHPRSWVRRVPTWIFVRLVVVPVSARATGFLERLIARVVTPQFATMSAEVQQLSERNDAQHADNVKKIEALADQQAGLVATIAETNTRLSRITEIVLTTPGFPNAITGEVPVIPKEKEL